jgi:hypothetical protein
MQTAAFGTSSGCSLWPSRSARFAFPSIITSGTNSPWEAGPSQPAHHIAATYSLGMVATVSSPFAAHFTLDKAAPPIHHPLRKSSLESLLESILLSMSSIFSSRSETPNQALERTADRRGNLLSMTSTLKTEAQLAPVSGRSACSR